MSALEKMREAFDSCTVMAGVEPDFECIYITKDAANALFDEAEAENAKLRELVKYAYECAIHSDHATCDDCERMNGCCILVDRMRELRIEVDA